MIAWNGFNLFEINENFNQVDFTSGIPSAGDVEGVSNRLESQALI